MRKANETKQQLDSCHSSGLIVTVERNAYIDSTSERNSTNKKLRKANIKLEKGRNNWRLVSITMIVLTTISTIF